ncbi:acyltransferase family protein [Brevundimonas sp. TSRC1-1]|uniref:acyltransferase family protein n=1 Tax=Brevundimonas sp. TSRC1-1 TaxID=2804562 RepID=UPI003CE942F5
MSASPEKLLSIQVLRGIAAMSVLFGHAQTEAVQMSPEFSRINFAWGAGVDLFFVISGFIMVLSSQRLFQKSDGVATFLWHRFVRVVPLYWFYTTLMIVAALVFADQLEKTRLSAGGIISSYLFFPHLRWDGAIRPILSLGWTLNYEMFFYLLFSGTLLLSATRGMVALLCALVLFAIAGALFANLPTALAFWTDSIILEFGGGAILGWLYLKIPQRIGLGALAGLTAAAGASFILFQSMPTLPRFVALGVPATLLVAAALWGRAREPGRIQRWFANWIGESSYSMYLSHPFAFAVVKLAWPLKPGEADWVYVLAATIVGVVGGILSYVLVEQPLLARAKRVRSSQAAPAGGN